MRLFSFAYLICPISLTGKMDGNVQGIFRGIKRRFLATENSQVWLKCHLDETYHKQCS